MPQNMFPQPAINLQKNATNVNKFQNNFFLQAKDKAKWVDFFFLEYIQEILCIVSGSCHTIAFVCLPACLCVRECVFCFRVCLHSKPFWMPINIVCSRLFFCSFVVGPLHSHSHSLAALEYLNYYYRCTQRMHRHIHIHTIWVMWHSTKLFGVVVVVAVAVSFSFFFVSSYRLI